MRTSHGFNSLTQRFTFKMSKRSMGSVGRGMINPLVEKETLDPCIVLMKQIIAKHEGAWKERNDEVYSLAQGVVYWSPPSQAYQYMDRYKEELHLYAPDEGWPAFRNCLSEKLKKRNGLSSPHFMVTSGANQAFMNVVLTLMNGSDGASDKKALFFVPYYFNHVMAVQMAHGNDAVVLGPVDLHTGYPNVQWLEEQLNKDNNKHISMVTIVNPGNPTGVNIPPEIIQQIASLCKEQQVWLVLDHTYEDFRYDQSNSEQQQQQQQQMDQINYFPQLDNVIHIFSMSKAYAMAGFRVGYVVLPSEQIYNAMLKVQDTIAICAPKLSQVAAMGALQWQETEGGEPDWVTTRVQSLKQGRDAILQALKPLPQILGGSGAMYLMAKLPENIEDDVKFASDLVKDYGVAVIPGSFCGLPGWFRVCYGNLPPDKCIAAAERLTKGIEELCFAKR